MAATRSTVGCDTACTITATATVTPAAAPPKKHRRVTVALAGARSAAIAGDWNDWSPAPMSRTRTGRWTTVIQVPPGVHHYAILVDGTRWTVPRGAPLASDGFGGKAALLIIPEA